MKKIINFNRQILKTLRRSKVLILIMLVMLVPIYIILTPLESSGVPSDYATFDKYKGTVSVFPEGNIGSPPIPAKKIEILKSTTNSSGDIVSIAGGESWAHLQLWRNNKKADPILQAGTNQKDTLYTFPCRAKGAIVVGWGLHKLGTTMCDTISVGNSNWKASTLQSSYLAEKAMTKQLNENEAQKILENLKEVNIGYSVAKSALLEWISNSDRRYYNVAIECLNILQNQRLKNNAPDIDVIFYYYKELIGVQQLPQNPQIDQNNLREAIRKAYNNKNGTDSQSFEEIITATAESIQDQVRISRAEDLTLIYAYNDDNKLVIDVLVGAVTVQAADNPALRVEKGDRYIYLGNGDQGSTIPINPKEIANQPPVNIFLEPNNWSDDITPLIQKFQEIIYPESVIR